jgi:hypothetical protein
MKGARETIVQEVSTWETVTAHPHRFGGTEFRIGNREVGHIHGDYMVDIPFPTKVRDDLVAGGRAEPHHILPDTGWVSFYIRKPDDVQAAVELLRLSFEIASRQKRPRAEPADPQTGANATNQFVDGDA